MNRLSQILADSSLCESAIKLVAFACLISSVVGLNEPAVSPYNNRDGYGRQDPNKLLNGFFPVWGIILLCIAGVFLIISLLGFIFYSLGCRPLPVDDFKKLPVT